jgi:hypothetical protein
LLLRLPFYDSTTPFLSRRFLPFLSRFFIFFHCAHAAYAIRHNKKSQRVIIDKKTATKWNKNIVLLNRVGEKFGMPVKSGATTYVSPLRYEFYITTKYEKIN